MCLSVCVCPSNWWSSSFQSHQLFTCKTPEEVSRLRKEGAKVDVQRGDKATPLMVHAENGNKEVVQQLISYDANVDTQDEVCLSVTSICLSCVCNMPVCISVHY